FRQHGHKIPRKRLAGGAIDSYPVFINQLSAQVGGISHNRVAESGAQPAGSARCFTSALALAPAPALTPTPAAAALNQGGGKQRGRAQIQQSVNQSPAAGRRINI